MYLDYWVGVFAAVLAAAIVLVGLTLVVMRRPRVEQETALAHLALQVLCVIWICGYLLSYAAADPTWSYFWFMVAWAAICFVGLAWLTFCVAAAGHGRWLTFGRVAVLALPGVLAYLTVLTNDSHHLFFASVSHSGMPAGLSIERGPAFAFQAVSTYVMAAAGVLVYSRLPSTAPSWQRWHRALVVAGVALPIVANALVITSVVTPPLDVTPIFVLPTSALCSASVIGYWLSDIARTAFSTAAEQMGDGVAVFDLRGRLLDGNVAFFRILRLEPQQARGKLAAALVNQDRVVNPADTLGFIRTAMRDPEHFHSIDVLTKGPEQVTLEFRVGPVYGAGGGLDGHVVTIRDVTESRRSTHELHQTTTSLRDAVEELETLHSTALGISAVRDLAPTVDLLLMAAHRLTQADVAHVAVLGLDGESLLLERVMRRSDSPGAEPVRTELDPLGVRAVRQKTAAFTADPTSEGSSPCGPTWLRDVGSLVAVPLLAAERTVGVMYFGYGSQAPVTARERDAHRALASQAAIAIANALVNDELARVATTDAMTGLPNHRHLMDRFEEEIARARRTGTSLAVLMLDIDNFKLVNDAHGHVVGDRLLGSVAQALRSALRETDTLGRYGGDEFLVLLPDTGRAEALVAVERITGKMRARVFRVHGDEILPGVQSCPPAQSVSTDETAIPVLLSVGISVFPDDGSARTELVRLADAAMFASKRAGGGTHTLARTTSAGVLASQGATLTVLEGLVNTVDAADHYTRVHSEQVALHSLMLAEALGLPDVTRRMLNIAAILHDIGKIGIPDRVLRKPSALSDEERDIIRQHPLLGAMIMAHVPQLSPALDAVRHHHEHYDGSGYPMRLKGQGIPHLARLIAVADAYSAMVLDHPYRRGMTPLEAIAELRRVSGTQLDPALVDKFVAALGPPAASSSNQTSD